MGSYAGMLPRGGQWKDLIQQYLHEDVPWFDVGGFVVGDDEQEALLIGKSSGKLAGTPFFDAIFEELGCTVEWFAREGDILTEVAGLARVRGPGRAILQGERIALNILARASGIATAAAETVVKASKNNWGGEVAGTRKTTPGFRLVEKYALVVGGVSTHRMDLSSMVMLKDNHIWSSGSITAAVKTARKGAGFSSKIEVEARSLNEAFEAASAGADIVMLDNYSPRDLQRDASKLKESYPYILVEASGGITNDNITDYMLPEVDVISMGKLTQGYQTMDFSLKIQKSQGASALEDAQRRNIVK